VRGAVAILPVLVGVVPFGLVAGLAGVSNGLGVVESVALSVVTYAGAAQIAALDLIGSGAPTAVVLLTAGIINLRFVLYSATLAPFFRGTGPGRRALGAYALTDHAFALSVTRFPDMPSRSERVAFYLGAAGLFWVVWQVCVLAGSLLGAGLPSSGLLSFAVPLSFLALLAPQLTSRPPIAAALAGGTVAVATHGLPANLGMLAGTAAGIAAGMLTRRAAA
jgi:predicted branched-subunit amino acid permease